MPSSAAKISRAYGNDAEGADKSFGEFEFLNCTNNSMPLADKPYDPPELPEVITAHSNGLGAAAALYREGFRPLRRNYVNMFFRVRRRNFEALLWQLFSTGVMKKENIYNPECMPYWTASIGVRLRNNCPMGRVVDALKSRLGISNPGIRFCIDGFFGMIHYSDIFGNTVDVCPWMEVSNFSTVLSLRLQDGDSVFISIATPGQIENVLNWRKKRSVEAGEKFTKATASEEESEVQQVQ